MRHVRYLIIGGGMTAAAAANGIRELDADGSIALVSAEAELPYDRPPLSKKLWAGKKRVDDIYVKLPEGVETRLGREIVHLNPDSRQAEDDHGEVYTYDRLLLATGGAPRLLPFGAGLGLNTYRTLNDYRALRAQAARPEARFVVIGGGFIGSEVAASLRLQGRRVTLVFPERGICDRLFPADLAAFAVDYYREQGVEVLPGEQVVGIEGQAGGELTVLTGSGKRLAADGVVVGIGIVPSVELAQTAGLAVDNGITVDDQLRTSRPEIFAAGDVASYPDPVLGIRRRVEHADAARAMGRVAGRNMAGAAEQYAYLPMFYSDLFDLGYEGVGRCDSRLEVVADWQKPFRKGVLYYGEGGRVVGVVLWEVWNKVDEARALIERGEPLEAGALRGRIH